MSDYYTASGNPGTQAQAASSTMRAEFASVAAAFAKIAGYSGNAGKLVTINDGATAQSARDLTGTANQVTVTPAAGSITLSLPQNIHAAATPAFAGLTLAGSIDAFVFGVTRKVFFYEDAAGVSIKSAAAQGGSGFYIDAANSKVFVQIGGTVSVAQFNSGGLDNCILGAGTPAAAHATTLSASGAVTFSALGAGGGAVSVGAADSGGAGFRALRVPN